MGLIVVVAGAALVAILLPITLLLRFCLVRVHASQALLVYPPGREPRVSFSGALVMPFHGHELVDLSAKEVVLDHRGRSSLRCKDHLRADVVFAVTLAIRPTAEDVTRAARALRSERTHDATAVHERFASTLDAALTEVISKADYDELFSRRVEIEERFVEMLGEDLDGYTVRGAHFREVAQTPIDVLDRSDVLDAVAIRKLTERTGAENARTRELREALVRAEGNAQLASAMERATEERAGGYRSDTAAAEARLEALELELEEARRVLAALRGK